MKKIVIIGAGPAGLTAAYELLKQSHDYEVIILEETDCIGGISKTIEYKGNRMDMGGHRFFSKVPKVNEWWDDMLTMQGARAKDDILLGRVIKLKDNGPDPEKTDCVMLSRHRISRILFNQKFYDYPISLKWQTIKNMGFFNTIKVGCSYLYGTIRHLPEDNLENFFINRFGKQLYNMFFENYTENLWGRHPREIDASWGEQRVKGLSIKAILSDIFRRITHNNKKTVETSLIEEFKYPKLGPGQLWEVTASKIQELGGTILLNSKVTKLTGRDDLIASITYISNGTTKDIACDCVISSMPLKDLVNGLNNVPTKVRDIANGLPYRDFMTLGVLVDKLNIENCSRFKTVSNILPDCWIYVHDRNVKLGRIQIFNNWSPYLVKDLENTVWIGLEYFVNEGDKFWQMSEDEFSEFAINEILQLGLIENRDQVKDTHLERVKKAYPAYFDTYSEIDTLIKFLDTIHNLYCVGRNGQHRYNNIDHSMITSFEAVSNILNGRTDKSNIWSVNTEEEYHEEVKKGHNENE